MAKRKSPKELMAARNPLIRTAVTPVDIYSQAQPPVVAAQPATNQLTSEHKRSERTSGAEKDDFSVSGKQPKKKAEPLVAYSTYLNPTAIKKIKWRALERETKDYRIVQEAIDEYFEQHPKL